VSEVHKLHRFSDGFGFCDFVFVFLHPLAFDSKGITIAYKGSCVLFTNIVKYWMILHELVKQVDVYPATWAF